MNSPLEVSRETQFSPDQIDLSTLNDLLRGVAVHEGMALMVGEMRPNRVYGAAGLHREVFLELQGDTVTFAGSTTNQLGWCRDTLEPAGIVERAPVERREYKLTDIGNHQARGLSGWMLQLSLDAGEKAGLRSLHGVNRTASSKETSTPTDRINIFEVLLKSEELKASEVAKQIGVCPNTAVNNLKWLAEHNIIEYTSVDSRDLAGKQTYEIPDDYDKTTDRKGMAKLVIDTVDNLRKQQKTSFTVKDLMDNIRENSPEAEIDTRSRKKHAMMIINELVAEDMLIKGPIDGNTKSKTVLLPGMRNVVRRSVEISDAMLNGGEDFVKEGKTILQSILQDKEAVSYLIQKWHKESPATNKLSYEIRQDLIVDFLKDNPRVTSAELAEQLKPNGMTLSSAKITLNQMRKLGIVHSTKVDSRNNWFLAEE